VQGRGNQGGAPAMVVVNSIFVFREKVFGSEVRK
jgi:hypothetical protein